MGITVIGGGSAAGADTLGTYSKTTLTAGEVQKCTLDLSTGNTFVLDDIYNFRNTILDVSNAPTSGTLGKYDVFLPADASAFASFQNTAWDVGLSVSTAMSRSTSFPIELYTPITSNYNTFFCEDGYIAHFVQDDSNQLVFTYALDKPYDLSKDNNSNLLYARYLRTTQLAGASASNQLPLTTDREYSFFRLFHIDNDGTFFLFIDGSTIKKLKLTSKHSFAEPHRCTVIESFTPTNIVDPDTAAITQDGKYLYCFDYTNSKMTNYILSNPFDLTTATYHSSATGITDIVAAYGQMQIPKNGNMVLYNIYNISSAASGGIYSRTMSTPHDLSTLSSAIKITGETYVVRLSPLFDDESKIAVTNVQSTRTINVYSLNYTKPSLLFSNNILPTDEVKKTLNAGKATKFSLVTADGGNTFTAY